MNIETVNELIASLESAGELSIIERKYLELAKEFKQLAAENVGLKQAAEFATAPDMWVEQADGMLDYRYHEWYVDVLKAAMETPATDSIVSGIKADGAKAAGDYLKLEAQHMPVVERLMMQDAAEICYGTAARLREGAK
ncbi:TPA: hypothetical protein ACHT1N_002341 [Klebsiella pneumoniae]|uniref:hypothetical protein n=1 Tax=Klebsiella pneumoniae TaxID=573 RepID=UPI0013CAC59B|nr:hypothetical protein [Klebsiella pneumoniae]HDG7828850.1 hypothetical protein [Klebsiella quasipneumoniae]MBA1422564.1 hypothetical protein [Klebsiella pneumoniae]MBZ1973322.1 hypothetical protein [Klebsiella pneumoniae]MDU0020815.1 hypothetical protein [Klebsiella pneumoniae]NGE43712.1 hypothetical protein [Klebsiella pneumoniae]